MEALDVLHRAEVQIDEEEEQTAREQFILHSLEPVRESLVNFALRIFRDHCLEIDYELFGYRLAGVEDLFVKELVRLRYRARQRAPSLTLSFSDSLLANSIKCKNLV